MFFFLLWFAVSLLFFLLELTNPGLLLCLSFSCGAAVACILAYAWEDAFFLQATSFIVVTLLSYISLCWWIQKNNHQHDYKSNIDALRGKKGILIVGITHTAPGSVKIGGELWMALSLHQQEIPANTLVQVIDNKGVHLIVNPVAPE